MHKTLHQRAGLTMIEVLIAVTVLAVTLGSVAMSMSEGSDAWRMNMSLSSLDAKTERTLDRVVRLLEPCSGGSVQPDFSVVELSNWIDFAEMTGVVGNVVVLGPNRRLATEFANGEVDNGIDDNGNGLIDELRVVLVEDPDGADERRIPMASGISEYLEGELPGGGDDNGNGLDDEPGLSFDMDGDTLNIRLSMEKIGPNGQLFVRTLETSITLLN